MCFELFNLGSDCVSFGWKKIEYKVTSTISSLYQFFARLTFSENTQIVVPMRLADGVVEKSLLRSHAFEYILSTLFCISVVFSP